MGILRKNLVKKTSVFLISLMLIGAVATVFVQDASKMISALFNGYLIILLLFFLLLDKGRSITKSGKWLVLFLGYTVCTTVISGLLYETISLQVLWHSVYVGIVPIIGYIFAFYLDERIRKKVYKVLYNLIMISIPYGFYRFAQGATSVTGERTESFFLHPIVYGSMLLLAFWLTFYLIQKKHRWLCLICIVVGIVSTESRSSWLALVLGIVVLVLFTKHKNNIKITFKKFLLGSGIIIGTTAFLFSDVGLSMIAKVTNRFDNLLESLSALQRLGAISLVVLEFIAKLNPLAFFIGYGTGASSVFMSQSTVVIQNFATTDNQYLTILFDYGIVGLFFVCFLIFDLLQTIKKESEFNEIKVLALATLTSGVFTSFFYELLGWKNIATVILFLIGVFYAIKHKKHDI